MLISHLSSFSVIEVNEDDVVTPFQALSFVDDIKKSETSITSFKDAQQVIQKGQSDV